MIEILKDIDSPVIIVGMHRSGTSLLSQLLEKCGVFQGYCQDVHNESLFFQIINENIFRQEESTWDCPEKLHQCLVDPDKKTLAIDYVKTILDDDLLEFYWGPEQYQMLKNKRAEYTLPWGWKDPRNTITLPVWLELFPESKVIHIIRNGIDVAVSLWRREKARGNSQNDPHYSDRCQTLTGCFDLWERYVHTAQRTCGKTCSVKQIRYEDLLFEPVRVMEQILTFLDLDDQVVSPQILSTIRSDRRFAYLQDDPAKEFYQWAWKSELFQELYGDIL